MRIGIVGPSLVAWTAVLTWAQVMSPTAVPAPDQRSNDIFELRVRPVEVQSSGGEGAPQQGVWGGRLEFTLVNVSRGVKQVDEDSAAWAYECEVSDSSGKPVPMTELGKQMAAARVRPGSLSGPVARLTVRPLEGITSRLNVGLLYQIKPGYAYTIRVRRSHGLPVVDESGKPLPAQRRELSYTVQIPGKLADE